MVASSGYGFTSIRGDLDIDADIHLNKGLAISGFHIVLGEKNTRYTPTTMPTTVGIPPPRQLTNTETLESLEHWRNKFRAFFKRDSINKKFLISNLTWDPNVENYGFLDNEEITAVERCDDFKDFLYTLAGFLPHSYLTTKIVEETRKWEDIWNLIYEHYGVNVTSETMLDFENMRQDPGENHRQFFERLLSHTRRHLAPEGAKVDLLLNKQPDKMSISLMNIVALQWLRKINPDLIEIIKTEYSTELRSNSQLAELIPRIAPNIDSLLKRYSSSSNVQQLEMSEEDPTVHWNQSWTRNNRGNSSSSSRGWRGRDSVPGRGGSCGGSNQNYRGQDTGQADKGPFRPTCQHLAQKHDNKIHFKHYPNECPRNISVNMLDEEIFPLDEPEESIESGKDIIDKEKESVNQNLLFQTNNDSSNENGQRWIREPNTFNINISVDNNRFNKDSQPLKLNFNSSQNHLDIISDQSSILKIEERKHLWSPDQNSSNTGIRKEKSPMLPVHVKTNLKDVTTNCTIDEGSEINCLDESFAVRAKIGFLPTKCKARAAGSTSMELCGQTIKDVELKVNNKFDKSITWNLSKCIVVKRLGVDILIGEPGKVDNMISTIPHKKIIITKDDDGKETRLKYHSRCLNNYSDYVRGISTESRTLYPSDSYKLQLSKPMPEQSKVAITPSRGSPVSAITPYITQINGDGSVDIVNNTESVIVLSKGNDLVDIRACKEEDYTPKVNMISKDIETASSYFQLSSSIQPDKSHLNDVIIDPDNQLSSEWKLKFKKVCEEFLDILNPRPGRYNGYYGNIDNSINFCSTPPPSIRAHLPKYSTDMMKIMGEKMDKMEEWGVLVKPEEIGVVPSFVVPSMLVPKPEKGEWRLVSDFTPLNIHIKKLPVVTPTIQEAKQMLAKFRYHIQLDLSNYFWQGGMKEEDSRYLATPHPYKGLRIYAVEPQGLRNASEHSYERLARIYGDMCADERMTRMADGLYILGDTLEELKKNFEEVLIRGRNSGLTFKPSKVIIAPLDTVLFGWQKINSGWRPTEHTITPLTKAEPPTTVKQLRSFNGSYKQLTDCIKDYAILLGPLEEATAGKKSAERVVWSETLKNAFDKAKNALNDIKTIHTPKPTDKLHTYSDYSQQGKAIGGSLIINRKEDGVTHNLLGGHFSVRLNNHQKQWLPCEGEALGTRLVLEHFSPFVRESNQQTTHHTDNLPTVHAWKRMKTGAFSSSARISAFLTGLSCLNVELVHTPGRNMNLSDYGSRHPNQCETKSCQICKFAYKMEVMGDNVIPLRSVTVDDIEKGLFKMPYSQRNSWLTLQLEDSIHRKLSYLMDTSQLPEPKRTKGDFTIIKRLHSLYKSGQLKKAKDGLITVTHIDRNQHSHEAISIPPRLFPGLVNALHIKLSHPSKLQLLRMISCYFYSPGMTRIVDEVSENCVTCSSLKQLPKEIFSESTEETPIFGSNFSADIIKKDGQLIFLAREKLSQFTITKIILDETADTLRDAIVAAVLDYMPEQGSIIQVDCSTGLQTLAAECNMDNSILYRLGIKIDLGRVHNVNKNPIAENAIREFHKERLRLKSNAGPINEIERAMITKNMNSRIRTRGLTAKEMALQRDQISNKSKPVDDIKLATEQLNDRLDNHPKHVTVSKYRFAVGDNVFLKKGKSKLKGRDMYKITNLFLIGEEEWATINKSEWQLRNKRYDVKISELIPVPKVIVTNTPLDDDSSNIVPQLDADDSNVAPSIVNKPLEDAVDTNKGRHERARRKTAVQADNNRKDMVRNDILNVVSSVKKKHELVPTHGWNYNDWIDLLELADDDEEDVKKVRHYVENPTKLEIDPINQLLTEDIDHLINNFEQFQSPLLSRINSSTMGLLQMFPPEEEELQWDHSPQYLVPDAQHEWMDSLVSPEHNDQEIDGSLQIILQPSRLFPSDDDEPGIQLSQDNTEEETETLVSLTSTDSDDVFFDDPAILNVSRNKLQRKGAFRHNNKGKPKVPESQLPDNNILVDSLLDAEPQLNPNRPVRDVDQLDYNMFHKYGKKHRRRK